MNLNRMLLPLCFILLLSQSACIHEITPSSVALPIPATLTGNDNIKYGYPGGQGRILVKKYYVILHEDSLRIPEWVTYHLTKQDLEGTANRNDKFRPDPDIPIGMRAELADYKNSEYDRGHMAPAGDFKRSEEAMSETFFLSNMAPQRPKLNRGIWEKLEEQVRSLAESVGSIWIVTGTLFLDEGGHATEPSTFIGPDSVAVPTHFYKAILCEHPDGTHEMFAFIMENRETALPGKPKDYVISVRHIEELTGLDFFNLLRKSEQDSLETVVNTAWPSR
jgi:endonuclease G, mitochondrial